MGFGANRKNKFNSLLFGVDTTDFVINLQNEFRS